MKKKLLIINQTQFGYHIDYVQYARFLKKDFEITFLCWDYQWSMINESDVSVEYVSRKGSLLMRNVRFMSKIFYILKSAEFHLIFLHYFKGCSIIPLLCSRRSKIHLDIRTGDVSQSWFVRTVLNYIIRLETVPFLSISIISSGLKNHLKIKKRAYVLPLGANSISVERELKHRVSLIYVGTLTNRRIEDTVEGLNLFLKKHPSADIYYTIIGNGWNDEENRIRRRVQQLGLQNYISVLGYIPHHHLDSFYKAANVGVSYVPITTYYNYQPATKTFEYLLAGCPVIATATYENKQVINDSNGFVITDSPESFAACVESLNKDIDRFNEEIIRASVSNYKWDVIINNMKREILD